MSLAVLLQAPAPNSGWQMQLLLIGGMILVFWLLLIRPQTKKAKEAKKFQEGIQKGDKVVTIGGIHGVVHKINEDNTTISLEVSPGSFIKVEKFAISIESTQAANKAAGATPAK